MPTTRHLTLLLLATHAIAASVWAQGTSESAVRISWPERTRPGASSVGPRSAARKTDTLIEPATFEAAVVPKPLAVALPIQDRLTESVALPTEPEKATVVEEAVPVPSAVKPTRPAKPALAGDAGRRLDSGPIEPLVADRDSSLMRNPLEGLLAWRPSSQQLTATGGGLAIAVGLLLSTLWLVRSCAPKSARPLPRDVVEVLGRAPLGAKQTTQLVRVGSKLVLVAITPEGAKTLTEVTDPGEVQRLIVACESNSGRGSAADFDQMLQQIANEPADQGFLGAADRRAEGGASGFAEAAFDPRSLAAAYANTPGGRGDG